MVNVTVTIDGVEYVESDVPVVNLGFDLTTLERVIDDAEKRAVDE